MESQRPYLLWFTGVFCSAVLIELSYALWLYAQGQVVGSAHVTGFAIAILSVTFVAMAVALRAYEAAGRMQLAPLWSFFLIILSVGTLSILIYLGTFWPEKDGIIGVSGETQLEFLSNIYQYLKGFYAAESAPD